jgi:hypothetical protein
LKVSRTPIAIGLVSLLLTGCNIRNPDYHPGATAQVTHDNLDQQAVERQMAQAKAQADAMHTRDAGPIRY